MRHRTLIFAVTLALLSLTGTAAAEDLTGKWTGTWESIGNPRGTFTEAHQMTLKQDGAAITGTTGPRPDFQWEIQNAKLEGNKLTFNSATGQMQLVFALEVEGDSMNGTVTVTNRPGISWKMAVKREK
jgi:hypothetical protein